MQKLFPSTWMRIYFSWNRQNTHENWLVLVGCLLICFTLQGVIAGVPFFDEVFRQLDCTYVVEFISPLIAYPTRDSPFVQANPGILG